MEQPIGAQLPPTLLDELPLQRQQAPDRQISGDRVSVWLAFIKTNCHYRGYAKLSHVTEHCEGRRSTQIGSVTE